MKTEERHSSTTCHYLAVIHVAETCFRLVYKDDLRLSPSGDCRCQSEDLHSTRAEIRNRLPGDCHRSVPQQCGRVCFCQATNQWVKSEGRKCQRREIGTLIHLQCLFSSSYRVFARGLQSTTHPGRLLLTLCGLGPAFISCPGLQTHLWTTRSGTHTPTYTPLCLFFSFYLCIHVSVTLPDLLTPTVYWQHFLFWLKNWHQVLLLSDRITVLAEWRIIVKMKGKRSWSCQLQLTCLWQVWNMSRMYSSQVWVWGHELLQHLASLRRWLSVQIFIGQSLPEISNTFLSSWN